MASSSLTRPLSSDLEEGLDSGEIFWRTHYEWLKDQGYQLRPRFAPDWTPSWRGTKKSEIDCEDGLPLMYIQLNDATHIPTGSRVALKLVEKKINPVEEEITRYFSTEPLSNNPRNHCVPLLDVLHPPLKGGGGKDDSRIFVLPFLRLVESPLFDTFGEAIECIRQLFEGVHFMHEHHVAHRDLNPNNFMMESEKMFPKGYHSERPERKADLSGSAKFYTRTQRPTKYFIIDFGISRKFDATNVAPLEPVIIGGDPTVPEYQNMTVTSMNPFLTDVYCAGNIVRQEFIEGHPVLTEIPGYKGFDFLKPLIGDMVQDDPAKRPKMDEVVKRFDDIVNGLSTWKLRSRTSSRRAHFFQDVAHMFSHWRRRIVFVIKGTPPIPRV